MKFNPSCFLSQYFSEIILLMLISVCSTLSHLSLQQGLLPFCSDLIHFFLKPCCCTFCLRLTFSLLLVVQYVVLVLDQFPEYLEWFDNYVVVSQGWDEPRVLLLCHHLSSSPQMFYMIKVQFYFLDPSFLSVRSLFFFFYRKHIFVFAL